MTTPRPTLMIREFTPGDEVAFRQLNEEWITRHFVLESKDLAALSDPQSAILARGGRIFVAIQENQTVGCCALLPIAQGEFEVAKMAVSEEVQGHGIGRRILNFTIEAARNAGVRRLYLETNQKLEPAIRLYRSVGFQDVAKDKIVPSPYARANVYLELYLDAAK